MFHLAYAGGLRVSELVGLRLADLTLHPQPTIHVMGKGRRERVLPLWQPAYARGLEPSSLAFRCTPFGDPENPALKQKSRGAPPRRD
jgi:integrase/recombinase XerD